MSIWDFADLIAGAVIYGLKLPKVTNPLSHHTCGFSPVGNAVMPRANLHVLSVLCGLNVTTVVGTGWCVLGFL